jgi:nitrous oxide reductase accessory protein NosL
VRARVVFVRMVLLAAALGGGCARPAGPPRIRFGAPCATCGMTILDSKFACERVGPRGVRQYDSIECLLRAGAPGTSETIFLSEYDEAVLHASDSLWVVHGDFPSPMSGGLAAFADRPNAELVAKETRGRVGRLAEFARADGRKS